MNIEGVPYVIDGATVIPTRSFDGRYGAILAPRGVMSLARLTPALATSLGCSLGSKLQRVHMESVELNETCCISTFEGLSKPTPHSNSKYHTLSDDVRFDVPYLNSSLILEVDSEAPDSEFTSIVYWKNLIEMNRLGGNIAIGSLDMVFAWLNTTVQSLFFNETSHVVLPTYIFNELSSIPSGLETFLAVGVRQYGTTWAINHYSLNRDLAKCIMHFIIEFDRLWIGHQEGFQLVDRKFNSQMDSLSTPSLSQRALYTYSPTLENSGIDADFFAMIARRESLELQRASVTTGNRHIWEDVMVIPELYETFPEEGLEIINKKSSQLSNFVLIEVVEGTNVDPDFDITSCNICLDSWELGSMVVVLPCKHRYHSACIDKWIERSECCPLCKVKICG